MDKWAWHHPRNGEFTLRSAYYIAMKEKNDTTASSSSGMKGTIWGKLWHSQVPAKIKMFGWRAMHNGLAVKGNLVVRGLGNDRRCPVCGEAEETIMHTLVLYDEVKDI